MAGNQKACQMEQFEKQFKR